MPRLYLLDGEVGEVDCENYTDCEHEERLVRLGEEHERYGSEQVRDRKSDVPEDIEGLIPNIQRQNGSGIAS